MKSGKRTAPLAAVLAVLVSAAGAIPAAGIVSAAGTVPDAGSEKVYEFKPSLDKDSEADIKVISHYDNFEALDAAGLAFQEYYPNVTIEHEKLDDYYNLVSTRVQNDPQVALFFVMPRMLAENKSFLDCALDLNTLKLDLSGVNADAYKSCTVGGKFVCIPLWFNLSGMAVNRTILEKEGLEIPMTRDEFEDCCGKLKKDGYVPIQGHQRNLENFGNSYLMNLIQNTMTKEQFEALRDGEEGSTKPVAEVFDLLKEYRDKGWYTQEADAQYEDGYDSAILRFFEGDVPFIPVASDTMTGFKKRESKSEAFMEHPFDYEFIDTPLGEDAPYYYADISYGFAINKNCENLEMAEEFYRFVYTQKTLNLIADIKGAPSVAAYPDNELYGNLPELPDEYRACRWDFDDPGDAVWSAFRQVGWELMAGTVDTAQEAEAEMEKLAGDKAREISAS